MIFAATPNPPAVLPSLVVDTSSVSGPEDGSDVSVREGGGAIAAPAPAEDQEIRQSRYINIDVMITLQEMFGTFYRNIFHIKLGVSNYKEIVVLRRTPGPEKEELTASRPTTSSSAAASSSSFGVLLVRVVILSPRPSAESR